jgi:hypothetical protein
MVDQSRTLLASLRDGPSTGALLRNSRAIIDESRRLLEALEHPAPTRRYDHAHHDAIATTAPIDEPSAGGVRADADRHSAMLSVRVFQEGLRFGWTLNAPSKDVLGRGTAETERQARIDALGTGMTYIDRAKGRSSPSDTNLH